MVLLIIIPFLNGYFIGNINPTFSDKPMCAEGMDARMAYWVHWVSVPPQAAENVQSSRDWAGHAGRGRRLELAIHRKQRRCAWEITSPFGMIWRIEGILKPQKRTASEKLEGKARNFDPYQNGIASFVPQKVKTHPAGFQGWITQEDNDHPSSKLVCLHHIPPKIQIHHYSNLGL